MGFDTLPTLLLNSASFLAQMAIVVFSCAGGSYFRNTRTYFMVWNLALAITGSAMIRELPHEQKWARYAGYCMALGFTANFPLVLAMISGNFGGFTKKMTVNAMVRAQDENNSFLVQACVFLSNALEKFFIAYCAGNIVGPQLFFAHEAPEYQSGFLSMMVCFGVGIVLCIVLRFYVIYENLKRDRSGTGEAEPEIAGEISAALDKTDKEIPQFRYVY